MPKKRVPKAEYFEQRLKAAQEAGDTPKAEYFKRRLDELKQYQPEVIELEPVGMFGSRKTIEEAVEYAESMNDIHVMTATLVMYNTIAEKYNLVEK